MLFNNKQLSVERMIELEDKMANSSLAEIGFSKSDEELARQLKLQIVTVHDNDLPKDTEATLSHNENPEYFGLIKVKKTYRESSRFACIHEIIHYVFDVGCGKYVNESFERKIRGKTQDDHEQEINYLTASYSMPLSEISRSIQDYDNSSIRKDELIFIDNLCKKYGQKRVSILRRIREIKRIERYRKALPADG